jgi:hypothetical protein
MKAIRSAFYARVSSEERSAAQIIGSQLAAWSERPKTDGMPVPPGRQFVNYGHGPHLLQTGNRRRRLRPSTADELFSASMKDRVRQRCDAETSGAAEAGALAHVRRKVGRSRGAATIATYEDLSGPLTSLTEQLGEQPGRPCPGQGRRTPHGGANDRFQDRSSSPALSFSLHPALTTAVGRYIIAVSA